MEMCHLSPIDNPPGSTEKNAMTPARQALTAFTGFFLES
jgi:hypothetical protein